MPPPPASRLIAIGILAGLLACRPAPRTNSPQTPRLLAGTAAAVVNPPVGSFIAGDKQNRQFTGVHDSLYAKAVVLHDGQQTLALLTIDCIGLMYPEIEEIGKRAAALVQPLALKPEHVVVSSTHTHSGPDVVGLWGPDYQHSGVDSAYMAFLIATAAQQVREASQQMRPVSLRSAETEYGAAWVQNICDEEIDRSVVTLQLVDDAGASVATLTNFACHPTYLDGTFTEVSADYVGGFYQAMNAALGGENLFLQGAIGGWVQPVDGTGSPEKAQRRGGELAAATLAALAQARALPGHALHIRTQSLRFRLDNEAWRQLAQIGTVKRSLDDSVRSAIAWFAIGEAQFATHPAETAPWYGLATKDLMQTDGPKFVLGLSMDALGYFNKPAYFDDPSLPHAPYLTSMSLGRDAAPDLMNALEALIPMESPLAKP